MPQEDIGPRRGRAAFGELALRGPTMWNTYEETKDLSVSNVGFGVQSASRWTESMENPGTQIAMYSAPPGSGVL